MRPSAGTPGGLPSALAVAHVLLSFGGDAAPAPKPARKRASGVRPRRPQNEDVPPPAVAPPCWDDAARRATREITCKTYLRRLNITKAMASALFADVHASKWAASEGQPVRHSANASLFRVPVTLVDAAAGRAWPVQYELLVSAGQRHARFSRGWATFSRDNGLAAGHVVTFERALDGEGVVVHVRVDR